MSLCLSISLYLSLSAKISPLGPSLSTAVLVEQGESGSWAVPPSSFVTGSEVVKDKLMLGYALMDLLLAPGAPVLLSDVGDDFSPFSQGSGGLRRRRRVDKK